MEKKRRSMGIKLITAFVITSIIPIILLNLFSYYNIFQLVNDNNHDLMQYNLSRMVTTLDISMESYEDVLFQIRTDDTIVDMINRINNGEELVVSRNQLRRTLRGYLYAKDYIKDISIITEDGTLVFYDSLTGAVSRNAWIPEMDISQQELYDQIMSKRGTSILPAGRASKSPQREDFLFHLGARIVDFNKQNKEIGVVIISMDEALLESICSGGQEQTAYNFIVDTDGTLISYRDKQLLGSKIANPDEDLLEAYTSFSHKQNIFSGESIAVDYIYDEKMEWNIVNVSNQNEVLSKIKQQQNFTFGIMIVLLAALIVIITLMVRGLTSSIRSVVKIMQSTGEGKLHARVPLDEKMPSEVEVIARQYNTTMDQMLKSLEKEKQMDMQMKDAEIMALEAQLNPHFLYNTLDTINWIAIGKQEFEISRAITALAVILRYGIDNSNGIVTIRDEYEWLKQYLLLQQTRLREEFEGTIDISPELMEKKVHKLLFQPFVENSFIHGFEGVRRKHILRIEMKQIDEGHLSIVIEDNGKGMPKDVVLRANEGIFSTTKDKNQLGLMNAFYRIQLYYGEEAHIQVESEEDTYTKVIITIPVIEEKGGEE